MSEFVQESGHREGTGCIKRSTQSRKSIPSSFIARSDRFASKKERVYIIVFSVQGFPRLNGKGDDHTIQNKGLLSRKG